MPFIHTKVNREITKEKEQALSRQLGEAISLLPGKSESWLMLQFEDNCRLYFKGDCGKPLALVTVKLYENHRNSGPGAEHRSRRRVRGLSGNRTLGLRRQQFLSGGQGS